MLLYIHYVPFNWLTCCYKELLSGQNGCGSMNQCEWLSLLMSSHCHHCILTCTVESFEFSTWLKYTILSITICVHNHHHYLLIHRESWSFLPTETKFSRAELSPTTNNAAKIDNVIVVAANQLLLINRLLKTWQECKNESRAWIKSLKCLKYRQLFIFEGKFVANEKIFWVAFL